MHGKNSLLPLASISFGCATQKILVISKSEKISVMWALVTMLCPWKRRFTMIISAWWLQTNSKFM